MRTQALVVALALVCAAPALAAPKLEVSVLEARTHADGQWFGENAYHFRMAGLHPVELDGKSITWTLYVKRKLGSWKSAKAWAMGKQRVMQGGIVPDFAFALLYRSMAKAKLKPGEHVAALVATTDDGREVYRGEIGFNLPANGRHAYDPRAFK